jgi:hypothetical protein
MWTHPECGRNREFAIVATWGAGIAGERTGATT